MQIRNDTLVLPHPNATHPLPITVPGVPGVPAVRAGVPLKTVLFQFAYTTVFGAYMTYAFWRTNNVIGTRFGFWFLVLNFLGITKERFRWAVVKCGSRYCGRRSARYELNSGAAATVAESTLLQVPWAYLLSFFVLLCVCMCVCASMCALARPDPVPRILQPDGPANHKLIYIIYREREIYIYREKYI